MDKKAQEAQEDITIDQKWMIEPEWEDVVIAERDSGDYAAHQKSELVEEAPELGDLVSILRQKYQLEGDVPNVYLLHPEGYYSNITRHMTANYKGIVKISQRDIIPEGHETVLDVTNHIKEIKEFEKKQ